MAIEKMGYQAVNNFPLSLTLKIYLLQKMTHNNLLYLLMKDLINLNYKYCVMVLNNVRK